PDDIYNNPASPFVYDFIGQVNEFKVTINEGVALVGDQTWNAPEFAEIQKAKGISYIRPHDIELSNEPVAGGFAVRLDHVSTAGAVLRLELKHSLSDDSLHVELPRAQERSLNLDDNAVLYARPTYVKTFVIEE